MLIDYNTKAVKKAGYGVFEKKIMMKENFRVSISRKRKKTSKSSNNHCIAQRHKKKIQHKLIPLLHSVKIAEKLQFSSSFVPGGSYFTQKLWLRSLFLKLFNGFAAVNLVQLNDLNKYFDEYFHLCRLRAIVCLFAIVFFFIYLISALE